MVTKVAIITIKVGILMVLGTNLLIAEIIMFDPRRTKVTPMLIPSALSSEVLIASAGHKPSARMKIGLEMTIPLVNSFTKLANSAYSSVN